MNEKLPKIVNGKIGLSIIPDGISADKIIEGSIKSVLTKQEKNKIASLEIEGLKTDPGNQNIIVATVKTLEVVEDTNVPPVVPEDVNNPLKPHPYYTRKKYTIIQDGVETVINDPYPGFANDCPPSKNGVVYGRFAAPSLYGYPDETNTGVPNGTKLTFISDGELKFEDAAMYIKGTKYTRPANGQPPLIVGPVTLYPRDGGVTHPDFPIPGLKFINVIEKGYLKNKLWITGTTNTLVTKSLLVGNTRRDSIANIPNGNTSDLDKACFMFITDSRIDGGNNSERGVGGGVAYILRCNVTGGADVFQPATTFYVDFCYGHGTRIVLDRHQDAVQIARNTLGFFAQYFGGWGCRIRQSTLFSYGEKAGSQLFQLGDITGDLRNVLIKDCLAFGGQYMYGFGFGDYFNGYGTDSTGKPITVYSGLTKQEETHPWVKNIFYENHRVGRKAADGISGGGDSGGRTVPRYGVTAAKDSSAYFNDGLYGDGPGVSIKEIRWEDDNSYCLSNRGIVDWDLRAQTDNLDFSSYTYRGPQT